MKNFIVVSLVALLSGGSTIVFADVSCDELYNSLIQNKKQCSTIKDQAPFTGQLWCEAPVGQSCTDTNEDWKIMNGFGPDWIMGLKKGPTGSELRLSCWHYLRPAGGTGKTPNSWCINKNEPEVYTCTDGPVQGPKQRYCATP